ncbi:hypothetical protein P7K49_029943, partial [Saguinus oedipus]
MDAALGLPLGCWSQEGRWSSVVPVPSCSVPASFRPVRHPGKEGTDGRAAVLHLRPDQE